MHSNPPARFTMKFRSLFTSQNLLFMLYFTFFERMRRMNRVWVSEERSYEWWKVWRRPYLCNIDFTSSSSLSAMCLFYQFSISFDGSKSILLIQYQI